MQVVHRKDRVGMIITQHLAALLEHLAIHQMPPLSFLQLQHRRKVVHRPDDFKMIFAQFAQKVCQSVAIDVGLGSYCTSYTAPRFRMLQDSSRVIRAKHFSIAGQGLSQKHLERPRRSSSSSRVVPRLESVLMVSG